MDPGTGPITLERLAMLSMAYFIKGDTTKALEYLDGTTDFCPEENSYLFYPAKLKPGERTFENSYIFGSYVFVLETIVEAVPDFTEARNLLYEAYVQEGDTKRAAGLQGEKDKIASLD